MALFPPNPASLFNSTNTIGDVVEPGQMPTYPGYQSQRNLNVDDPTYGLLGGNLNLNPGKDITGDQRGMDAFRGRALNTGPSAWAGMQTARQSANNTLNASNARSQSASSAASAKADLASRGGLTGGAAERVDTQANRDNMNSQQQIAHQGSDQSMQIGIQDEQNRQNALAALPGMEVQNLEPAFRNRAFDTNAQQFNINNAVNDKRAGDIANMSQYQTQMQTWAAANQANATAKSAPQGKK